MRALVIDDSRAMRAILGKMLRQLGFEVSEAANGQEGLDALHRDSTPDITLVDWNMPVMNGYEFVKAVRADATYSQMPLMMVTTETEMRQVGLALEAGVNEYVMKPFSQEVIVEKLSLLGLVWTES